MSLDYAAEHLAAAVRSLASSEAPLQARLQQAWDGHVQFVWEKPCLTRDLLREFRDLCRDYTAPSDDRQSTTLRPMDDEELRQAIGQLVSLASRTAIAAALATPDTQLATLADLGKET